MTGNYKVPTLVLDDGTIIDDSKNIIAWAKANPVTGWRFESSRAHQVPAQGQDGRFRPSPVAAVFALVRLASKWPSDIAARSADIRTSRVSTSAGPVAALWF
jgi:hypothetical protein